MQKQPLLILGRSPLARSGKTKRLFLRDSRSRMMARIFNDGSSVTHHDR